MHGCSALARHWSIRRIRVFFGRKSMLSRFDALKRGILIPLPGKWKATLPASKLRSDGPGLYSELSTVNTKKGEFTKVNSPSYNENTVGGIR